MTDMERRFFGEEAGMAKKWVRIVRFCIEKEKMGVKAMIFIDRIAPREGYQAEWRGGG